MAKITEELPRQKYLLHQTNSGAYLCESFLCVNCWKVTLSCELSLVKYSHISVWDIEQAARASHTANHDSIAIAEMLYGDLQFNILPTENDLGII